MLERKQLFNLKAKVSPSHSYVMEDSAFSELVSKYFMPSILLNQKTRELKEELSSSEQQWVNHNHHLLETSPTFRGSLLAEIFKTAEEGNNFNTSQSLETSYPTSALTVLALQNLHYTSAKNWLYRNSNSELLHLLLDRAEQSKWWDSTISPIVFNQNYEATHFRKIVGSKHWIDYAQSLSFLVQNTPSEFYDLVTLKRIIKTLRSFVLTDEIKAEIYCQINGTLSRDEVPTNWGAHMFDVLYGSDLASARFI